MSEKYLVIVESYKKAPTIHKYLGKDYKVVSSGGHIRDLAKGSTGRGTKTPKTPKQKSLSSLQSKNLPASFPSIPTITGKPIMRFCQIRKSSSWISKGMPKTRR